MVKVGDYEVPEGLYYSKDYMWARVEGEKARIGITDYAQKQLREIVYAELPSSGDEIKRDEPFGTLESVKAVSDLVAPISGTIEEVNEQVANSPEILNEDPYSKAWLLVMSPTNLEEELKVLMDFRTAVEWHKDLMKEG
nr:glycine cleavage system protein GcvH [Candidatus Njordarchaeum guaymaensis]